MLLCAACEATIDGGQIGSLTGDATNGNDDSGTQTQIDAPPSTPQCSSRVVFLNFDGVTLTDATASDATQNRVSWMMGRTSGTVTPFQQGNGNRAQIITDITQGVRTGLSQFPITVVTTRPTTGPYVMIAYGGDAQAIGSNYGFSVNELDCDESEKSDVAWISNNYTTTLRHVNTTIGAIGFGLGLTGTSNVNDCMCGWANNCNKDHSQLCTLSTNITRDPNATQLCNGAGATQNEVATFNKAFCE